MKKNFFFVSDLHGKKHRYTSLFQAITNEQPEAVFIGGDIMPSTGQEVFFSEFLMKEIRNLQKTMRNAYPAFFIIPGNDDLRSYEDFLIEGNNEALWNYIPNKSINWNEYHITGYPFVPPTPFRLKDWEKYDVSRFVDPGCIHPSEGKRSVKPDYDPEYATIFDDLKQLTANLDPKKTIMLFHTPPYKTALDRAALDGIMIEHVPLDVHVGSIAVKRIIEEWQPLITLHGHIHESAEITGSWQEIFGKTHCFSGAGNVHNLTLVRFRPDELDKATRSVI